MLFRSQDYPEGKRAAFRENAHERLCQFLTNPSPEVRTSAVFALGHLIGGAGDNEEWRQIEKNIGLTLFVITADMSPMARQELLYSLSRLIFDRPEVFLDAVKAFSREEMKVASEIEASRSLRRSSLIGLSRDPRQGSKGPSDVYTNIWKLILTLRYDPFPPCSELARKLAQAIFARIASDLGNAEGEGEQLRSHVLRRAVRQTSNPTPNPPRRRGAMLSPLRDTLRQSFSSGSLVSLSLPDPKGLEAHLDDFNQSAFISTFYEWSFDCFNKPIRQIGRASCRERVLMPV